MESYEDRLKRAKKWGKAHGYEGRSGGWIYRTGRTTPVVQGWGALFYRFRRQIEAWEATPKEAR